MAVLANHKGGQCEGVAEQIYFYFLASGFLKWISAQKKEAERSYEQHALVSDAYWCFGRWDKFSPCSFPLATSFPQP